MVRALMITATTLALATAAGAQSIPRNDFEGVWMLKSGLFSGAVLTGSMSAKRGRNGVYDIRLLASQMTSQGNGTATASLSPLQQCTGTTTGNTLAVDCSLVTPSSSYAADDFTLTRESSDKYVGTLSSSDTVTVELYRVR